MSDELNLPWKLYFFNEDGKYRNHLVNYTLEYRLCRFYITVEGYNEYGRCTITRGLSTLGD
jgi:hypothetical protein